ncbi:hypothetical protein IMZ48_06275 [Candidatus Bathyarchaeota archaeon]|nr:hypothetical protein [Candidatus Bathyarchaeota archaeon]
MDDDGRLEPELVRVRAEAADAKEALGILSRIKRWVCVGGVQPAPEPKRGASVYLYRGYRCRLKDSVLLIKTDRSVVIGYVVLGGPSELLAFMTKNLEARDYPTTPVGATPVLDAIQEWADGGTAIKDGKENKLVLDEDDNLALAGTFASFE